MYMNMNRTNREEKAVKQSPPAASDQHPASAKGRSRKELYAMGKELRTTCPRRSHAGWKAARNRPDAVRMVLAAEKDRSPDLLPLRHGRMAVSPFTFYRGAALTMASDLASIPVTGVRVQCCGDAHLCNFGGFATPERKVIFSINDLDETLPAPWEWDVKRLAASFVVGCRDNGLSDAKAKDVVMTCVRTYRESLAELSHLKTLELWYMSLNADDLVADIKDPAIRKRGLKRLQKERGKSIAEDIFPKLVETNGEWTVIRDQLPTIFHAEKSPPGKVHKIALGILAGYRDTLPSSTQSLLDRYEVRDVAFKVVGVGSVGTSCSVYLLMAAEGDPLFLQLKEARPSVLEPYAGASRFPNHGQRIVDGYRLMQPASDLFLGWSVGPNERLDGTKGPRRHCFIRQLRDIKISVRVETFGAPEMNLYATWCGKALALSHARSGSSAMLSGYMGKSDTFDQALASFAVAYANQNEKDHAALKRAIRTGKVKARFEEAA
jgi:uncharacterized protein (DUF2252 family)